MITGIGGRNVRILLEIIVLYIGFPLLFFLEACRFPVILILPPLGLAIFFFLKNDASFSNKQFYNWPEGKRLVKHVLVLFAGASFFILAVIMVINPSRVFFLIREKPLLFLLISVFYPVFSVIPQALAYRALFFHRYAYLFRFKWVKITVSALLFSFGHIVYKNWLVLVLTFFAGIIFAYHYYRSKSLALSILEHSMYGVWLFASGLGMFFISGRV